MSKENNRILTFFAISLVVVTAGGFLWLLGIFLGETIWFLAKRDSQSIDIEISKNQKLSEKVQLSLVGNSSFSGYSILRHPEFKKKLSQEYGIEVNYQEYDRTKKINLLNRGQADIWVTTLDRYLQEKPKGKIVGLIDRSVGADAMIVNSKKYPDIESIEDLNNLLELESDRAKRIGITYVRDSSSEYLARVLNSQFDAFNLAEFKNKTTKKAADAWELLKNPQENVAVGLMSEPYVTLAKKEGYKVLLSSKDTPKSIVHVMVASNRTLASSPEKIIQFLEAYYKLIDRNVLEPAQIKEYIATESKLSLEEAEQILQGIDFFTATEAQTWMENGTLANYIDSTASKLVATGKIREIADDSQAFFTSEFIERSAGNTGRLIRQLKTENPQIADRLAGVGHTIALKPEKIEKERAHDEHASKKYVMRATEKFASEEEQRERHQHLDQFKTTKVGNLKWNGTIAFEFASAQLDEKSSHVLEHVAEKISELNPETVAIRVVGHTSKTGTVRANQILSQQRAQVVIDALRDRGLQHKFISEGKGFSSPLPNYPPEHYNQQRTEIIIERIQHQ